MADTDAIIERLREIEEQLRDLAYEQLREAAAHNDKDAVAQERRFLQARRAIAKAISALDRQSGDER